MRFNAQTPAYSRLGPNSEQMVATFLRLALSTQKPTKLGCEARAIALLPDFRQARCLVQQGKVTWAWRTRGSCRGPFRRGHLEMLVRDCRNHAMLVCWDNIETEIPLLLTHSAGSGLVTLAGTLLCKNYIHCPPRSCRKFKVQYLHRQVWFLGSQHGNCGLGSF